MSHKKAIMPDVSFAIGPRHYTLRCAAGQEEHLRTVAAALDARVRPLARAAPGVDDRQVLVMAALALLDELQGAADGDSGDAACDGGAAAAAELATLREENADLRAEIAALRTWAGDLTARLAALAATVPAKTGERP